MIMDPGWVFVPQDLDYFIKFEEQDFARRGLARREGK